MPVVSQDARLGPDPATPQSSGTLAVVGVSVKLLLLGFVVMTVIDPEWGHLTGKAPTARAVLYPTCALILPALWLLTPPRRRRDYPWAADLLITVPGFADIVGNRLNLYDRVSSFDDIIHFTNVALVSAGIVLLTMHPGTPVLTIVERGVAFGLTVALGWELFEYVSFMTRSPELPDAYADTLGDLGLGWLGALVGSLTVALTWSAQRRAQRTAT